MDVLPIQLENKKLIASFEKHLLEFITPAKTSRETFKQKETYVLKVGYSDQSSTGVGECSPLWTLSVDPKDQYEEKLQFVCDEINNWKYLLENLSSFPSILFGLETALLDLTNGGKGIIFPSDFTEGKASLKINGLIWMGDFDYMSKQIEEKINDGFDCVKLKIGAIDWADELTLLKGIRKRFSVQDMEIRVDANGAFTPKNALVKLNQLHQLKIHSIEQPIVAGQMEEMAELCSKSELAIALDEELIGNFKPEQKKELLNIIKPAYLVIKPSLVGGIQNTNEWIKFANENNINWWLTSALEGNITLNALAQYSYKKNQDIPHGLGTGQLYKNNFESRLIRNHDQLAFIKY